MPPTRTAAYKLLFIMTLLDIFLRRRTAHEDSYLHYFCLTRTMRRCFVCFRSDYIKIHNRQAQQRQKWT